MNSYIILAQVFLSIFRWVPFVPLGVCVFFSGHTAVDQTGTAALFAKFL